jgi:NAD(P)-dependent dehydrogenase (short-subunit alcohol dehydrogenase family)
VTDHLITTPFGFASTAAEVIAGVDLSGRRAIVTGASSGIGIETARALADAGAEVTLAVRDVSAGDRVAADIGGNVRVAALDLSDLDSVDAFVAAWDGPLHILVNNAGVMAIQELTLSSSGHEMQFATNHLGHFALAVGLHGALASAGGARIVSVSSGGHLRSPVVFDDIDFAFRDYDPFGAYGQSKTANVLFAVEATRRWQSDGIVANALMPGGIATPLQRHLPAEYAKQALTAFRAAGTDFKTVEQGAATSTLLAASPLLEGVGGRYFEDCNQARVVDRRGGPGRGGVAPYALDPANAQRLWDLSLRFIGTGRPAEA